MPTNIHILEVDLAYTFTWQDWTLLKFRPHVYITIYNALSLMLSSFKGKNKNEKQKPIWLIFLLFLALSYITYAYSPNTPTVNLVKAPSCTHITGYY